MSLQIFNTADDTFSAAAEAIIKVGTESLSSSSRFSVVLSGGSTPRRLYQLLASKHAKALDWQNVAFFWGDERHVPPDHAESNFRMADETLLKPLAIPRRNIHRIRAELDDPNAAAQDYETEIALALQSKDHSAPPAFDLILLGLGVDGHTASLFPQTLALGELKRWVVANEVPQLNSTRITMTPILINRARRIFFLVIGADKTAALAQVLEGPFEPQELPTQLINPANGTLSWFCDGEAASRLRSAQ